MLLSMWDVLILIDKLVVKYALRKYFSARLLMLQDLDFERIRVKVLFLLTVICCCCNFFKHLLFFFDFLFGSYIVVFHPMKMHIRLGR